MITWNVLKILFFHLSLLIHELGYTVLTGDATQPRF